MKDSKKEYMEKYYAENKEAIKEQKAKYYAENKEAIKEHIAKYRAENKEAIKEQKAKYSRTIEGRYTRLKSKSKQRGLEMTISYEQYESLTKDNKCHYCDTCMRDAAGGCLDRIDNSKGYLVDNVVMCCGICNSMINNNSVEEIKSRAYKLPKRLEALRKSRGLK